MQISIHFPPMIPVFQPQISALVGIHYSGNHFEILWKQTVLQNQSIFVQTSTKFGKSSEIPIINGAMLLVAAHLQKQTGKKALQSFGEIPTKTSGRLELWKCINPHTTCNCTITTN